MSASAASIALLLLAAPAAAQNTEGAFQLSLVTDLLTYSTVKIENEDTGFEEDLSWLTWGVRDNVGVEVGYGVGRLIVVGAFLRVGGQTETEEPPGGLEIETSDVAVQVGPKLDLVFGDRGWQVRPMVGFAVALSSTTVTDEDMGIETSLLGFNLLARGGLHWFVVPAFSIDPMFAVSWGAASGELDEIDGDDSVDVDGSGFNVGLMLGISGWID